MPNTNEIPVTATGNQSCCCLNVKHDEPVQSTAEKVTTTARAVPSILMSVLIAFFPKCPFCWAVYMSMFGSVGLAKLPYMSWLLPVLMAMLAFHLFMLWRKAALHGYVPFMLSLFGSLMIVIGRIYFPLQEWILISGIVCVVSGSLLNSFFQIRLIKI
ncbi:hypothetical protein LZD49_27960 [Dyadobacter sp. CY261]|uniref:hypothetical protein n=1 Tax=Dyadobacter sp. CY261 TaxID=2907203 RepID=UPI001F2DE5F6|nr:hypothetical protein [Dyadobacter sp. CY261]MCF0074351.1 hypothetical protein [Dyadobacter sp. CY261]